MTLEMPSVRISTAVSTRNASSPILMHTHCGIDRCVHAWKDRYGRPALQQF